MSSTLIANSILQPPVHATVGAASCTLSVIWIQLWSGGRVEVSIVPKLIRMGLLPRLGVLKGSHLSWAVVGIRGLPKSGTVPDQIHSDIPLSVSSCKYNTVQHPLGLRN